MRSEQIGTSIIAIAGLAMMLGVVLVLWGRWRPRKPPPLPVPLPSPTAFRPVPPTPRPTATPFAPLAPTAHPHAPWMLEGIDFASGRPTSILIAGVQMLKTFTPHRWTPAALTSGIFDLGEDVGLAWSDDRGRVGLWLHSGDDQTASFLQDFLERDVAGYLGSPAYVLNTASVLIGAPAVIEQEDGGIVAAKVAAIVRVPPLEVEALDPHVGDLVEYVAGRYGGGFEDLVGRRDVLMLFFCGLRLTGEQENPRTGYWTQARWIVAFVPE